jgi:hypothetical protein
VPAEFGSARPSASETQAIVFAVYWPPHEPPVGSATCSSSFKSASLMRLAAWAPTPSNTSTMVTSLPWNLPGMIVPP